MTPAEKRATLAHRVRQRELTIAPGIFDLISTRIADAQGHAALYMTGYGTVASHLGLPDAGLASFSDMCGRAAAFAAASRTPLIADADTGYGGLLNVAHTVRAYEAAGVAAIQLEDQEFPKKCGHTAGKRVIGQDEMVLKIKVACATRMDPNFLVIARTDARGSHGMAAALARARAFREAGADVLFVEAMESEQEFADVARLIDAPLLANMVEGGRSPLLPAAQLRAMGYAIAIYPGTGFMAAAAALREVYGHLLDTGGSEGVATPLYPLAEMHALMGFEEIWAFDQQWLQDQP